MSRIVAVIATLDTKGDEVRYLKEKLEAKGKEVLVIDSGTRGKPMGIEADIPRERIAEAAGSSIEEIEKKDRGPAVETMQKGIAKVVKDLFTRGRFHAIMSLGGADGSLLASAGMRALPLGVPKFIVTPIAQGEECFGHYIGTSDIIMMHSVIDILGVNEISKKIFDVVIGAIAGMADVEISLKIKGGNLIAATMYGNTTPAVMTAKKLIEEKGYEVVVFHPNGTGGRAMEEMVERGIFTAVLDMTTHEITDEIVGGLHSAGPHRLEAAGRKGIPQLIVPGCVDFILAGPLDRLPANYRNRGVYHFNPAESLVRTSKDEMITVGKVMAEKLNRATGPTMLMIPLGGFSMYCHEGQPMHYPVADKAFIGSIKRHLKPEIKIVEVDAHINDPVFAETAVSALMEMMAQ
jgi:uncharacterized protein (UPF0261 family)